jgi:hypothetical protein
MFSKRRKHVTSRQTPGTVEREGGQWDSGSAGLSKAREVTGFWVELRTVGTGT